MNTDSEDTTMIKLKSMNDEDGNFEEFYISMAAAKISDLIRDARGDPDDDDDDDDEDKPPLELTVMRVKGPCLKKVVDFMNHHHKEKMKEIPTPLGGSSFNEVRLLQRSLSFVKAQSFWFGSCFRVFTFEKLNTVLHRDPVLLSWQRR
jgi:hypothetical protein